MFARLRVPALLAGFVVVALASTAAQTSQKSTVCQFDDGPRAGETQDYAPKAPLPVGSSCWDGVSSHGHVVPATRKSAQKSTLCKFEDGPRAGETQDYAPKAPLPVGSSCWDGVSSHGHVVASDDSDTSKKTEDGEDRKSQKSTLCKFEDGPRAGETQDYAPKAPLPVGSSCWDGVSSHGHVVARTKEQ